MRRTLILLCVMGSSLCARSFEWAAPQVDLQLVPAVSIMEPMQFTFTATQEEKFYRLPLTNEERAAIHELIEKMGTHNPGWLLARRSYMEKLGKKADPVHPFRFLGVVFSDPQLRQHMYSIRDTWFCWHYFTKNLFKRMGKEHVKGELTPYLAGFCQEIKIDQGALIQYIQTEDWKGFLSRIME